MQFNMTDVKSSIKTAKSKSRTLTSLDTDAKNRALESMAQALEANKEKILRANAEDLRIAEEEGLSNVMLKRLKVTEDKIDVMVAGIRDVISLKDPVGETMSAMDLDDGLTLYQISCPIGMIGVIFESRPDVVPQIMSLCLKSGNGVVFKGGKEATNSNRALFDILTEAVDGLVPKEVFVMIETREDVNALLDLDEYIDLLIPRGSNEFVKFIQSNTRIPVLGHAAGICHVYVDSEADMDKAFKTALDSKVQYPAVCNAAETLLVHKDVAERFLPIIAKGYIDNDVEIRCDPESMRIIGGKEASDEDWDTEYNDYIISVKVVDSLADAVDFINSHGSHHTDMIVTENRKTAMVFANAVDSADVFINASTRFADGFRFGKGAEVGISTNKIHSRGPVGMEGLMIYKYVLIGDGHVVKDYVGKDAKQFKHTNVDSKLEMF